MLQTKLFDLYRHAFSVAFLITPWQKNVKFYLADHTCLDADLAVNLVVSAGDNLKTNARFIVVPNLEIGCIIGHSLMSRLGLLTKRVY